MEKRIGRPLKYKAFLIELEDDEVYTPAKIVRCGEERGLFRHLNGEALAKARVRVRHTLSRFRANHFFPEEGDGMVRIQGQSPTPGWYGKRWKEDL